MVIDPAAADLPDDVPASGKQHLRTPVYRALLAGWTLANVGDSLLTLILAAWVADLTGSASLGGAVFAALGLPALAAPFLGALADRMSRRWLLVIAYVLGALVLVPLLLVESPDQVWLIFAATVLYSLVAYVSAACQSGLLRDLLPDEALGRANGQLQAIDQVLRIVGPIAGAGLYAWAGPDPVVLISIASFALAAVVFVFVRVAESVAGEREEHIVRHLLGGFAQLFGTAPLKWMAWALMLSMGAVGLINAIVFAALDAVGLPPEMLGPINATQGVAGIVSGLTTPRLMDRIGRTRVFAIGMTATGLGLLPLCFLSVPLVIAGLAFVGYGIVAVVIAFMTERQIETPERLQGRTAAAGQVAMNVPMVAMTALAASLILAIDYRILVAIGCTVVVIVGLISFRMRPGAASAADVGGRG